MKKIILFALFVFLAQFAFADLISNYYVTPSVPLDRVMTVTGTYNNDVNSGVLCKFVVFEKDGNVLERLTDEYTFSDSSFYSELQIREPPFKRGQDYNMTATCGTASQSARFSITNYEPVVDVIAFNFLYLKDNGFILFITLAAIVILTFLLGYFGRLVWDNFKK